MTDPIEYTRKDASAYYKKINKLREMLKTCDFSKDKRMAAGMTSYPYLSAGKIRQQFAPLFSEVGLEFEPEYSEPTLLAPLVTRNSTLQHWTIRFQVRFIDVDTGFAGPVLSYIGEGSDVLDKGLRKAMTSAYKSWLSDYFDIEEGLDPEVSSAGGESGAFTPRTAEEQAEIKSKLAAQAVKPSAPKAAPAEPAPVRGSDGFEPGEPGSKVSYTGKGRPNELAKQRVINWHDALTAGKVTQEQFEEMHKDYQYIGTLQQLIQFNSKYKAIE